jgi:hypothetical protein
MERLVEEITIGNEQVQLEHARIPLEQVQLDRENPRIRYRLGLQDGKKTLDELVLAMPEVKALKKDIELTGGLRERVTLQRNGKGYKVIEGNCRTACYRVLNKIKPDDPKWQEIPARILPKDVNAKHVAILLSDLHVAGKIRWDAHEKAGQVYRMSHDLHMTHEEIATYMRTSKSAVGRFYNAYTFMVEKFLTVDDGEYAEQGEGKWSFFDELYRSKELREELKNNPTFGDQFCRWVGEGRLPLGADVRRLPDILKNAQAREKFETGNKKTALSEAVRIVEADEPEHGSDFFKLLAKVRENCTNAAQVKEILRIRTDKNARKRVLETYEALVDFMRLADVEPPKVP